MEKVMKNNKKGFTLIELMITVAIIGILAAVALPAYQDYTIRAQISEGISLTSGAKTFVEDYYASKGTFPVDAVTANLPTGTQGKYISGLDVANGVISATFSSTAPQSSNSKINGNKIELTPVIGASSNLIWTCNFTGMKKYSPSSCRG
jgi:type IV pilus assembly protein PilA